MKVLVYSTHPYDRPWLEAAARNRHELRFVEEPLTPDTAGLAKGFEAVALFTSDLASAEVLRELNRLGVRYVSLRSAGYDHVDLKAAAELGMRVANVPAYSPHAVAEHAVTLLLALNRRLVPAVQRMKTFDFRLDGFTGFDLHGKTVGVVGTGAIGSVFARILHGFGCRLLAYDLNPDPRLTSDPGLSYVSLEELCANADVVSLHCPLNAGTRRLFDGQRLRSMKKHAVLVNTARGAIVDTEALLDVLDEEHLQGAALDVYEHEKPLFFYDHSEHGVKDELFHRLLNHPRVLLTGHQAFLTREALEGIAGTTVANLDAWAAGGAALNELSAS